MCHLHKLTNVIQSAMLTIAERMTVWNWVALDVMVPHALGLMVIASRRRRLSGSWSEGGRLFFIALERSLHSPHLKRRTFT